MNTNWIKRIGLGVIASVTCVAGASSSAMADHNYYNNGYNHGCAPHAGYSTYTYRPAIVVPYYGSNYGGYSSNYGGYSNNYGGYSNNFGGYSSNYGGYNNFGGGYGGGAFPRGGSYGGGAFPRGGSYGGGAYPRGGSYGGGGFSPYIGR